MHSHIKFELETYRVSKETTLPTHKLRSHSRAGNAPGSSMFPFAFDAILSHELYIISIHYFNCYFNTLFQYIISIHYFNTLTQIFDKTKQQKHNASHRGAVTLSNVNTTTGALPPAVVDRPRRTTVSPLRTDFTVAVPVLGNTGRIGFDAAGTGTFAIFSSNSLPLPVSIFPQIIIKYTHT